MNPTVDSWTCADCGYNNRTSARLCGLCGAIRPDVKPPPAPVSPQPGPMAPDTRAPETNAQRWDSYQAPTAAGPAAPPIPSSLPEPPQRESGPGMGALMAFVLLLPWSLVVLLIPGGLRNPRARKILAVVFIVGTVISLVVGALLFQRLLSTARDMLPEYSGM